MMVQIVKKYTTHRYEVQIVKKYTTHRYDGTDTVVAGNFRGTQFSDSEILDEADKFK